MARRGSGAGRLRIVAGEFGGRYIDSPRGRIARPTLSQVREAVFNILGPSLQGLAVADLFAGSGAYGFEALSRGAARVEAFERNRAVAGVTRGNAEALLGDAMNDRFTLVEGALPQALSRAAWGPYDLVFMDPPWREGLARAVCEALAGGYRHLLADSARLVVEESKAATLADGVWSELGFEVLTTRRYGDASVAVLQAR